MNRSRSPARLTARLTLCESRRPLALRRTHVAQASVRLFLAAVDTGDKKAASTLSGRLHENLARTAKLTGELVPHAGTSITNILRSPDFQRLSAELIPVLARYPQAQAEAVARFPPGGIEGSHRERRIGRENDRRASGRPVEGEPEALAAGRR